ncbi:hypothetical protein ACQYJ6_004655 [Escherichia coli]
MLRSNIIDAASSVEDLIAKLGGTGRGLREKTNSISHLLEPSYVKKINMIATVRNKAAHERVPPTNIQDFERAISEVKDYLTELYYKKIASKTYSQSNIIDAAISVEDLIAKLGGTGRGLREKTDSISHLLEPSYVKKINMIATVRNKAAHERVPPTNIQDFECAISEVKDYLTELYYKKIASKTYSQSNTRFENLSKEELREELARLADEEISRNKAELEYMRSGTFINDKITKETKQDTTEQQKTFKQQPNG